MQNPYLDEDIQPLALKENEIDDLVAFLASLTSDDYKKQGVKELARQRALSRTQRPQRDTGIWPETGTAKATCAVSRDFSNLNFPVVIHFSRS